MPTWPKALTPLPPGAPSANLIVPGTSWTKSSPCSRTADGFAMPDHSYTYLFGPVPSRRFGRSLGVDLLPFKTCTLDCLFCECGHTTAHTTLRKEYVPTQDVLHELDLWLINDGKADVITLAGSGEPTLHTGFGDVLAFLKETTSIPTVLLTNGTLLHLPEVRRAACAASIIKVSLSAWDHPSFITAHHPAGGITFEQLVEGEQQLRREFDGELWMEIFLLPGINDTPEQAEKIAAIAQTIHPDRIHLNTVVRPPAQATLQPVSEQTL
ncbi:MAG: radical SAM protein, partial [Spartobacteria bacterium]|nr:radical SAM protein [Spartobacteria bacterium]